MTIRVDPEWWKTLFDEVYLLTDARSVCDDKLTSREVDVICELLSLSVPGIGSLTSAAAMGGTALRFANAVMKTTVRSSIILPA